ncbi:MAG: ferritin-like domain-containing protein [Actinomycetota bacterium]|nr:ferritin-like domain-containing protein [Actinomycetota bacterium]
MRTDDGPKIDTTRLGELMEESRDLHVDAMRVAGESLPELENLREERKGEVDTDEIDRFNNARRGVLAKMGYGASGLAAHSLLAGGFGGLLAGLMATPARADTALDVQILQTASSLEALAIATYSVALGEGPDKDNAPAAKAVAGIPVANAKATVGTFAMETRRQHTEHKKAFQAQTTALGGKVQDAPSPKFLPVVMSADLSTAPKVVDFAATLEKVATDTYLLNLSLLQDQKSKGIMASVMAVESQHLATLRAVAALLGAGATGLELIEVPFPAANIPKLPAAAGSVATPDALHKINGPELIAEPASGAVK